MGKLFHHDFSRVRLHASRASDAILDRARAMAAARGNRIFVRRPLDIESMPRMLSHELAHVVQQSGGSPLSTPPGASRAAPEQEADGAAARASKGQAATVTARLPEPALQFQRWRGAYAERELVEAIMAQRGVDRAAAEAMAAAMASQTGDSLAQVYPELADRRYEYDINQPRNPPGVGPNCFGDVCHGGGWWEPTASELEEWLSDNGYSRTSSAESVPDEQKIAVYWVRYVVRLDDIFYLRERPTHITEQLPDGRWRSRLGGIGVMLHERPDQLVSQAIAARDAAAEGLGEPSSVEVRVVIYSRPRRP